MSQPEIVTFGCRLNAYESEVMRERAQAAANGVETVIVNTCAVTAEAERQARQAIRRIRRERPHARIVVTGCAAQVNPEKFAAMPEIDQILGNAEKMRPEAFTNPPVARVAVADIMRADWTAGHLAAGFDGRARAFVEIQQGCDHRCTFCVIPFGRGPSRSVGEEAVIARVRALAERGLGEVVLTGVDLCSWGADLPGRPSLGALARRLLAELPELPRLRLSSLDPVGIDEALIEAFAEEERLMPHAHLSVQAGDDLILKRMKRRHERADVIALAERLRVARPGIILGADLIAGFPTEDEAMFRQSLDLVDEAGLTHLHVFPFSARPGTPAARMPKVAGDVVKERARLLRAHGEARLGALMQAMIGTSVTVLIEEDGRGYSEHYLPVLVAGAKTGEVVRAVIDAIEGGTLRGRA